MSPILSLEAEIRAAVKTASAPPVFDLLAEIRAGVKLAGEAAVTPPSPAAPAAKPPAAPAPAAGTPPAAAAPAAPTPPAPAPGTPPAGTPPAPVAGKPTTPAPAPQPYQVPGNRPAAPQGVMSQGWDALKNNWDVAAIPLSLLAMMFGGRTGKMLGALGMAAGGYGLYNRYQNMQNYGEAAKPIAGETPEQFKARQSEQFVKNLQGGRRAARAREQADAKFRGPMEAAEKQFQDLLVADPALAAKVQPVIEAKNAMWEAKTAYNEALKNNPRDAEGLAAAKAAAVQAEAALAAAQGDAATQQAIAPALQAREAADAAKWRYQLAMKPWEEWEKANPQLSGSFKAVNSMFPGAMLSQIRSANPELKGATERTVQDLMYRLGHGDKPADYTQTPMTAQENQADRALAWLLQDPEAVEAMKSGGPGTLDQLLIGWNDRGAGKRWD